MCSGYAAEIDWQESRDYSKVTEREFLREAAWVILSAGMSERTIRRVFDAITCAFCNWDSGKVIANNRTRCISRARGAFGHDAKLRAIAEVAERIAHDGFVQVKQQMLDGGPWAFVQFSYIGPVTAFHLAKNLGMDFVKADRHLVRVARAAGFETPGDLCREIATITGDRVGTVDLVIWRFATLDSNYERVFGCETAM
ncbi:MAG: hypothetical protein J0L78_14655 [Planctomycetes bacterium]|nr:hypothetical protein [Planctomycetota bacterium]